MSAPLARFVAQNYRDIIPLKDIMEVFGERSLTSYRVYAIDADIVGMKRKQMQKFVYYC